MAASGLAPSDKPLRKASTGPRRATIALATALVLSVGGMAIYAVVHSPQAEISDWVDIRVGQLGAKSAGAMDPTLDKAVRVSRMIIAGDFATAGKIASDVLAESTLQNWRFAPYDDFIDDIFVVSPHGMAARLDEWVAKNAKDATPLLLRAGTRYESGWAKRGHDFIDKTSDDQIAGFVGDLRAAFVDVDAALKLDRNNPYGYYLRLRILQGEGSSPAMANAFAEAIERYPAYYRLYDLVLQTLQPRWGGSIPAMAAFVDKYAGGAPQFSPLKLLYLSFYRYLLSTASVTCGISAKDADELSQCTLSFMNEQMPPRLEQDMLDALSLYDHTDTYQFGREVMSILSDMQAIPGGEMHTGAVLQLAAKSMHSDTQLKQANPGHNDYVVDGLLAMSWTAKGFYDNAITKYNDALDDARNATFPSLDQQNSALGQIYDSLSEVASEQGQFVDEAAYEKAAVLLGWPFHEERICHGYYQLKQYDRAVKACSDAISGTGNQQAWYWRGKAYADSGRPDLALPDFKQAVAMDNYQSPYAVVDMSMIYFGRNDNQGALAALNSYPSVYDPSRTAKSQVAVAYNNRCYAYLQLNDLEKALADCTQSLRYGSIPEAIRKQQELLARLSPSGKTS